MTAVDEQSIIDPVPSEYVLQDGTKVKIEPLKTRQFFRLLKIVTQGAALTLGEFDLNSVFDEEDGNVGSQLLGLVLVAIPEAEEAALDFLRSMVIPAGLVDKPSRQLSKAEKDFNEELWNAVDAAMFNPDLIDTIELITLIIRREVESGNFESLGKRLSQTLELMSRTGQTTTASAKPSENLTPKDVSEVSADLSTSSPQSTDGTTNESLTSLLDD